MFIWTTSSIVSPSTQEIASGKLEELNVMRGVPPQVFPKI